MTRDLPYLREELPHDGERGGVSVSGRLNELESEIDAMDSRRAWEWERAEAAEARVRELTEALRQAPVPFREDQSVETRNEWEDFYAAWFHDLASDAALAASPKEDTDE